MREQADRAVLLVQDMHGRVAKDILVAGFQLVLPKPDNVRYPLRRIY